MPANKSASARPLSPFMLGQYYRFQITSLLSIIHRITGVLLAVGSIALAAWVLCAAAGPQTYASYMWFARSILGQLLLLGWSWALLYHLCNGIRHLVWDAGYSFEIKNVYIGGWIVVIASLVLTAILWIVAYLV